MPLQNLEEGSVRIHEVCLTACLTASKHWISISSLSGQENGPELAG